MTNDVRERATYTLTPTAKRLVAEAAERAGLSQSAWAEKALVYYAVLHGTPPVPDEEAFAEALADEREIASAEDEYRQRGAA
jgi:hypothetical protein